MALYLIGVAITAILSWVLARDVKHKILKDEIDPTLKTTFSYATLAHVFSSIALGILGILALLMITT